MADPVIEVVPDPAAIWDELEPLYRGLHEHHEPLRGFVLADGWQDAQLAMLSPEGGSTDSVVLVARDGGRAIALLDGLIRINPVTGTRSGYINSAFVEPDWRRRGLTSRMVESFEEWAIAHDAVDLTLGVDVANEGAVEAWRALGFEPTSYRMARGLSPSP